MRLLSIVLFASASNIDNFIVGMSYGVKKIHIPILANFIIAAMFHYFFPLSKKMNAKH